VPRDPKNNVIDLGRLDDVRADQIPAVLAQLAAASQQLAARLLANGTHSASEAGDRLLTAKEAAAKIGKSEDWLYRHAPELPYSVRDDKFRSVRFSLNGIEKWIRQRSGRRE
jgi:predicted DNA-binding transcriptional regulator AlpA